ncbi:Type 1 glutamine amidotransferase-like domain-containing protein [Haploplasma axanthum]|uniref:Uncharacterized peptidase Lmo0363 n=1 Tax=Haploplasma axanthum TaxID=29552 RepID=A0A449BFM2_HAPAX|nr:Type 1 glutamine amidotransferase-like domain-containing protein [Haploplasma axanthum]VEU81244.1 Uncharacterized peptidase Lmo0363 [Haploplasma axanthum]
MKKLFLTSSFKDVHEKLYEFTGDLTGKRVTFIPTAGNVEKFNVNIKSGIKSIEKLGMIVDLLDVSKADNSEIERKILENDIIYISGGNTFYLLQELKKSNAFEMIKQEVEKGKLYIGESAGSIITSPNIEYIKLMDTIKKAPELSDLKGLALVEFYTVPHQGNFPFKNAVEKILKTYASELNLQPISNKEVIVVSGKEVKII